MDISSEEETKYKTSVHQLQDLEDQGNMPSAHISTPSIALSSDWLFYQSVFHSSPPPSAVIKLQQPLCMTNDALLWLSFARVAAS